MAESPLGFLPVSLDADPLIRDVVVVPQCLVLAVVEYQLFVEFILPIFPTETQ